MPRTARVAPGGVIYHVMNRASGELVLFDSDTCYRGFLHLVAEAADTVQMRILAYCAMPNHWHLLVWPRESSHLRRFVQRLTIRHAHAWHLSNGSVGRGHLYQGRYKSFPVEDDRYLLTVSRYIERNPVRALLVNDAETWRWSSACWRASDGSVLSAGGTAGTQRPPIKLEPLPVETPRDWLRWVNEPQTDAELYRLRLHIRSGAALSAPDSEPDRQHARPMKTDPVRALEKRPRSRVEVVQLPLIRDRRTSEH